MTKYRTNQALIVPITLLIMSLSIKGSSIAARYELIHGESALNQKITKNRNPVLLAFLTDFYANLDFVVRNQPCLHSLILKIGEK